MSFILLGILNSAASAGVSPYWLSLLGGSLTDGQDGRTHRIATTADNSIYIAGLTAAGAGGDDGYIAKYDSAGQVLFQKTLGASGDDLFKSVAIDSDSNVYVVGGTPRVTTFGNSGLLAKYNDSGVIQFQKQFGTDDKVDALVDIGVGSDNSLYIVADYRTSSSAGQGASLIVKFNSSGTVQWQRQLKGSDPTSDTESQSVALDSSDNAYVVGAIEGGEALIAKYNSSGTLQWQKELEGASLFESVTVDSSDNIYVVGRDELAKFDDTGSLIWQRALSTTDNVFSVATDSLGNVYMGGGTETDSAGSSDFLVAKYDSSGNIVWQRILGAAGFEAIHGITINSNDDLVISGRTFSFTGGRNFLTAVLPNDGSLTGTYTLGGESVVYAESTLTPSTTTHSLVTSSLTASTPSLGDAATSLTNSAATLPFETLSI
jgi:hypothetical protein